ncbi:MAG: hypothetical protein SFV53_05435 [Rickettsiales bacterium]|nr:hypothetical protein [Rickettsiales bacterium]
MTNLNIKIISIEGVILESSCHLVVVPSIEGDLGIMFGHEFLITKLRQGKITLYDDQHNITKEIEVSGGYAEMSEADKLSLLIES